MLRKFFKSFEFAFNGFRPVWKGRNFRVQVFCGMTAMALAVVLDCSTLEFCLILLACGLVLGLEALNTSLEQLCDVVEVGYDEKIKNIKDMAACGVLIASVFALLIGVLIFVPKLF